MTVGEKIKELRVKNNLSQRDLAEMLGYGGKAPQTNISKFECGVSTIPESKIKDLCVIFNVTPEDLMTDTKYDSKKTEEGYSDPTASKAIDSILPKNKLTISPGATYLIALDPSRNAAVLALNYDDDYIYGLSVYRAAEVLPKNTSHMFEAEGFYVDLRYVKAFTKSKVVKELFYFKNFKLFNEIKRAMSAKLGLMVGASEPAVIETEKVVEKIVEVPANDTEFKLLKQKADIYQDICEKLLARGNAS